MTKAAVLTGQDVPLVIRDDITVQAPGPGEVRIDVGASGVCHSDVSVANGTIPLPTPIVLGHEGAGVVTEVGDGVSPGGGGRPRGAVVRPQLPGVLLLPPGPGLPVREVGHAGGRRHARRHHPVVHPRRRRCSRWPAWAPSPRRRSSRRSPR